MRGRGDVAVHERVVRIAIERGAGSNEHIDEGDLNVALPRDPRPRDELKRVIELLAQAGDAGMLCRADDRPSDLRDVRRKAAVAHRVFGNEPQQIGLLKEAVECISDLVTQPRTG
jgi:hypothetical protein